MLELCHFMLDLLNPCDGMMSKEMLFFITNNADLKKVLYLCCVVVNVNLDGKNI